MLRCMCGYSCGTATALERHITKFADAVGASGNLMIGQVFVGDDGSEHGVIEETQKILDLQKKFRRYDKSKDCLLDFEEMATLLRKGNPLMTNREIMMLFRGADKDGDNHVDFDEFLQHVFAADEPGEEAARAKVSKSPGVPAQHTPKPPPPEEVATSMPEVLEDSPTLAAAPWSAGHKPTVDLSSTVTDFFMGPRASRTSAALNRTPPADAAPDKPSTVTSQPATVTAQPAPVTAQPATTTAQPAPVTAQPATVTAQREKLPPCTNSPCSRTWKSGIVRVLLLRHAKSANKARSDRQESASLDPDLSETGYAQAEAVGAKLVSELRRYHDGNAVIASSPMRRCILTALPAVHALSLPTGNCLVHGGCYEYGCAGNEYLGSSHEALGLEFPEFQPVGFSADGFWDYQGSNRRETDAEVRSRAGLIVEWIWEMAKKLAERGNATAPKVLVLTIHQTMADLICQVLLDGSSAGWVYGELKYRLSNAGITELFLEANGVARLGSKNDSTHLLAVNTGMSKTLNLTSGRRASAKQVAELRSLFRQFDKSKDNRLDFTEMSKLLRKGNPKLTDRELWVLFDGADKTNDGDVDFDEFVEYIFSTEGY